MTFVIISGGIDLSVGSVIGFTTVFLADRDSASTRCRRSWRSRRCSGVCASVRGGDGGVHSVVGHAAVHRHAGRHVPGAGGGVPAVDRVDSDRQSALCRAGRSRAAATGWRTIGRGGGVDAGRLRDRRDRAAVYAVRHGRSCAGGQPACGGAHGAQGGPAHDRRLCAVVYVGRPRGGCVLALHLVGLFAVGRGCRVGQHRGGGDRRDVAVGRRRVGAGDVRRRADPGADPDLHQLRRHAVELVGEDRDRVAAVRVHHVPAGQHATTRGAGLAAAR